MKVTEKVLKLINKLKGICRIALIIAIVSLVISCVLTLTLGDNAFYLDNDVISSYIWFSIIGSIWVFILSTISLIISVIVYLQHDKEFWMPFKREIILTFLTIASLTILHLSILAIN